jgi:hypothetical protein
MADVGTCAYPALMDAERNWRILCVGWASSRTSPAPAGYLADYDPDGNDGLGSAAWTTDPAAALTFDSGGAAIALWRAQSRLRPVRSDGEPNRPLTELSIELTY